MSRIEDALKKAAALRKSTPPTLLDADRIVEPLSEPGKLRSVKKNISALLDVVPIVIDHPMLATVNDDKMRWLKNSTSSVQSSLR